MMKAKAAIGALVVLTLVLTACEKAEKVGSEELLKKVKEEEQAERLGEILKSPEPKGGSSPGAIQNPPPETARTPTPPPQQQQPTVEIALVNLTPYYECGAQSKGAGSCAQAGGSIKLAAGTLVRIVNKDDKTRRFQTTDGTYDSGNLNPNGSTEFTANAKGRFTLEDPNAPWMQGHLEVV